MPIRSRQVHYVTMDGSLFSFSLVLASDMSIWAKHPFAIVFRLMNLLEITKEFIYDLKGT